MQWIVDHIPKLCLVVISNVFITESIIKPEKLPLHGSLVGPAVKSVKS